jgi:integrase
MARRDSCQRGIVELQDRKDGAIWTIRYRVRDEKSATGWRQKREKLPHCKSKKEAQRELGKRVGEANTTNNGPDRVVVTFANFASGLWMSYVENKEIKPSTVYSYNSMLDNHLIPAFGKMRLDQILPMHLTDFFNKKRSDRLSPKYVRNLYGLLNTMFEVAAQYDLIASSPVRRKLHRPQYQAKEKPALSAEEIRRIIEFTPANHKPLFSLLAITSLRIGEVLGLRWESVNFDTRKLAVTKSLWRGKLDVPKTEASVRKLHLPDVLIDVLLEHRHKSEFTGPEDYVFCKPDGSPLDPDHLRNQVLYPAMDAAKIERSSREYGFHIFRHAAGSIVHAKTGDLKLAQKLLGHARISTTSDIYTHVPDEVAKTATEILAAEICCSQTVPKSSDLIQ